jgi:multisubunit Na+/H+ antiporter MnhE subunit
MAESESRAGRFDSLHRVELRNALSLAVFQQRITLAQAEVAWMQVQEDLKTGVLVAKADAWDKLVAEAETLASTQTPTLGTRTLDVMHVAGARVAGATDFCTFDCKQAKLAQALGLQVRP